ncbi:MAG TPA: folylpolyglutamate synthase/dihydrofolate synthase family protein [Candidatus Baltobacteraceae bacterium]
MSFAAAQAYLQGTINETISRHQPHRLERMRALLRALGDPQEKYPTLHVGGTSGKGSTSTMLAAVLTQSGKRTGLHTKPHIVSLTERMRVDGIAIPEEEFASLLSEIKPAIESVVPEYGRPTYYETVLALAFTYFVQMEVDVAVIEVGIGGMLDGTNVLRHPQVSVITNIGLDHMDVLGNTLEDIALDKAGIARRGVPLVSDVADPGPREQIERICAQVGAPFFSVRDLAQIESQPGETYGQSFTIRTPEDAYALSLPILGRFQQRNAATAILALEQLKDDLRPTRENIETGMSRLVIPGRMEFFPSHPAVVFDIAHNEDKARNLVDALLETFAGRRFMAVVAIGEAKDARQILAELSRLPASFIFTSFEAVGRTPISPTRLASLMQDYGAWGRAVNDPVEAFSIARRNAGADEIVLVTGSTYVVGTLRDWWSANVAARSTSQT